MYRIHLSDNQPLLPISEEFVRDTISQALALEQVQSAEIVVALVDDPAIHEVNREHLQHDYPTDVISFLYDSDSSNGQKLPQAGLRGAAMILDGELVISTETAIREAAAYDWNPLDELRLYLIHGLLHLCGYDDQSDSEQVIMRNRERAILKIWNLTPHYR